MSRRFIVERRVEKRAAPVSRFRGAFCHGANHGPKLLARAGRMLRHNAIEPTPVVFIALLEACRDELVLGAKTAVQAHLGHAGFGDHQIDTHGPRTLLIKEPVGSVEDALARRFRRTPGAPWGKLL